jgi:hypothetical protein
MSKKETKKVIESLTPEQEAKIPEYLEKFRAIGLQTDPVDRTKSEAVISRIYNYLKLPMGKDFKFIWFDSPSAIVAQAKAEGVSLPTMNFCQSDAYWVSFYSFIANELDVEVPDDLINIAEEAVKECGIYYPFEKGVLISERPCELHYNASQQLHNPNGLAIKFKDNTGVYALNGVRMPAFLFEVPKSQIKPEQILAITNVEQRLEAMKWYGLNAFLTNLGSIVLDKSANGMYELLEVKISDTGEKGRYLKMKNPSVDEIHVEGVDNSCETVVDAMRSRTPQIMLDKYGFQLPGQST